MNTGARNMAQTPQTPTALPLGVSMQVAQEIGERLRATRERLNIGLNKLSLRVKIRESYLESIEAGRWHELPPGLNGRGLVRVYAKELSVSLPEMEPQLGPQETHPHYQPTGTVSVVSRKEFERRIRDSGQETPAPRGRYSSVAQSMGTGSQGQTSPNSQSSFSNRSSTLPDRKSYSSPRASVAARAQKATPLGRMNEREDESLLDVVTPDVASILGISQADLVQNKIAPVAAVLPQAADVIPEVNAQTVVEDLLGGMNEAPETQPLSKMFSEKSDVSLVDPDDEIALVVPPHVSSGVASGRVTEAESSSESTKHAATQYASTQYASTQYADTQPPAQSQSPAHSQLPAQSQTRVPSHTQTTTSIPNSTSPNSLRANDGQPAMWKYFLAGIVAVVAISSVWKYFNDREPLTEAGAGSSGAESAGSENENAQRELKSSDSANSGSGGQLNSDGQSAPKSEGKMTQNADPQEKVNVNSGAPEAGNSAGTAGAEPATNPDSNVASPSEPAKSAESTSSTGLQPSSGAVDTTKRGTETSLVGTGAIKEAELNFVEAVDVQITVDGKKLLNGVQEIGAFKFSFQKRAEIFVNDGSKVRLKYGGWDHGVLGHSGRKRRLILNAESYGNANNPSRAN